MLEPFNYSDYANKVCHFSKALICSRRTIPEISAGMHLLLSAMERDLTRYGEKPDDSRIACGPGCGECCVLNVEVLLPEAFAIAWFLQRRLAENEMDILMERLQELHVRTRWLDDEERLFVREQCAFLDEQGSCMIHIVRPLLCRSITSTDPEVCRDAIAMAALEGAPRVEMNLFQKNLVDTVYQGLAEALSDCGYDHQPKRLTSAVLELLSLPGGLSTRPGAWLN